MSSMDGQPGQFQVSYTPECFNVHDMTQAKHVILGSVGDEPIEQMEERWKTETPYLVEQIAKACGLNEHSVVVDYGCGIGRVAKGLIDLTGCSVIGVDISESMRKLSLEYVGSPRFRSVAPLFFKTMAWGGERFDAAYCCWALQHFADPQDAIDIIKLALKDDGTFYVLNEILRFVPTTIGWVNDKISVEAILRTRFEVIEQAKLPVGVTSKKLSERSQTLVLRKAHSNARSKA